MTRRVKTILCTLTAAITLLTATAVHASAASTEEPAQANTIEVFGMEVDPETEFLDLSGIKMESTAQVEEILPLFSNLKQVDMVNCGISDEDMDALRQKHPDIKIVWEVVVCTYHKIRTDITYFMPNQLGIGQGPGLDFSNLKYCNEITLIDFGHYPVADMSFLYYMPNLEYLIVADSTVEDLSVIADCTSLRFLELFLNPITDFSPLLNLTNLEDLNISYTPFGKRNGNYVITGDFANTTPLYQMTWLNRLWMCYNRLDQSEWTALQEALPNTTLMFKSDSSTDRGWRHSPNYFAGRDIVGGRYMTS